MAKVTVDQETCIGCAACVSVCDNFEMKETNIGYKSIEKKEEISESELAANKEAEEICPVDAIKVQE